MMMFMLLLCLWMSADAQWGTEPPVVTTKYGKVLGNVMQSRRGRSYLAFRGIPYAKPPVGDLRFKAPQEPVAWHDIRDATEDAEMCIQQNYLFHKHPPIEGSEDCLYLNVYSPVLNAALNKQKNDQLLLPVIVFISYGAFIAGSSASDVLGPAYLMDKDVILVTFNYRLGIFGFFSTYDDAAPGNWAFKDQVAALKWVRDNVEQFGGDPAKVTICGQSAGAGSVHHHILSPLSRNLFQAAITQSGSALALWAQPQRELALIVAKTQAEIVGCNSTVPTGEMVDCLKEIPANTLVDSMNMFRFMRSEPLTPYLPTIEFQSVNNPEPFITKNPLEIIENGEFSNVPWIIGVAGDEGTLRAAPLVRQTDLLQAINTNFNQYLPEMLYIGLSVDADDIPNVWAKIKEFYFLNEDAINVTNPESIQGLINAYSDRGFLYPAYQSALLHKHKGHENVWFYYFDYRGSQTYGDLFAATENQVLDFEWGVSHCDDLLYLFNSPKLFPNFTLSNSDLEISDIMINLFTNFATYSDPTPEAFLGEGLRWKPLPSTIGAETIGNNDLHYLKFSGRYRTGSCDAFKMGMVEEYHSDRMSFWINLQLKENIENLS